MTFESSESSSACLDDLHPLKLTGHLGPASDPYCHTGFVVPDGADSMEIEFFYTPRNTGRLGFGLFESPSEQGGRDVFRGWSDHWRSTISLGRSSATPGYLPGILSPGAWNFVLAPFELGDEGVNWRVVIRFARDEFKREVASPSWATESLVDAAGWYRGDLHVHSHHSADSLPGGDNFHPSEVVARAKEARLDFIGSTDHNTSSAHMMWGTVQDDQLLVLNGSEVTMRGGHLGAVGIHAGSWIDFRGDSMDFARTAIEEIRRNGGLSVVNHPMARECPDCDWTFGTDLAFDAIEVWNGAWSFSNELALQLWDGLLRSGRRITAVGGSDAHRLGDVVGRPQTIVNATSMSREAIVEGLRSARAYIAKDAFISLDLAAAIVDGNAPPKGMGHELVRSSIKPLLVSVTVRGTAAGWVVAYSRQGVVGRQKFTDASRRVDLSFALADLSQFVRIEVREVTGAMVAISNPIWIDDRISRP